MTRADQWIGGMKGVHRGFFQVFADDGAFEHDRLIGRPGIDPEDGNLSQR